MLQNEQTYARLRAQLVRGYYRMQYDLWTDEDDLRFEQLYWEKSGKTVPQGPCCVWPCPVNVVPINWAAFERWAIPVEACGAIPSEAREAIAA